MAQDSDEDLSVCLGSGGSSSSRSRHAVIAGTKPFAWNNERVRSDQPYIDGRYHMPHNPPPNEVGFVDGIGRKVGRRRSKVHPQRPTQLQQICGMRNQNMILHSFTQPIKEVFCPVKSKLNARKTMPAIVSEVTAADMIASSISQLDSESGSVLSSVLPKSKQPGPSLVADLAATSDEDKVDGRAFYYTQKDIQHRVKNYLHETTKDDIYATTKLALSEETVFRNWALKMHANAKNQQQLGSDFESELAESKQSTRSNKTVDSYRTEGMSSCHTDTKRRAPRITARNIINKITGYMYGPFTKPVSPDPLTCNENKFGIPKSMTDRVQRFEQRESVQSELLRRLRMEKMGLRQPPTGDESSDENESMMNVKKLALLRTPYFVVPTIRMDRVKRAQRYCNKYLRGDRLKRVNLLLRDEKRPKGESKEKADVRRQQNVLAKFVNLKARKRVKKDLSGRDAEKAKFYEIIDTDYEKNRLKFEPDEVLAKPLSFGQFKNIPDLVDLQHLAIKLDPLEQRSDAVETDRAQSLRSRFVKSQPKKLFERNRNERLSQHDNLDGPFYIDPNLMDKFRSPKKFKSSQKYYTNLIKGKHWIRDRLQVNGPSFQEEKIGVDGHKYFHRLATEWDDYYIHDLRNRPRVRKFCVKTDILEIREITRRNYIMYHVQENLMDMKAKQKQESEYMDNVENFQKYCVIEFESWKTEAYDKVLQANRQLKELRDDIVELGTENTEQLVLLDSANLRVFQLENSWNYLMKLQNYYYLLQSNEWRERHDWIHRELDGTLEAPMVAYKRCSYRNIRPSKESSGLLIKQFHDENIAPNLTKMRSVQPNVKQFQMCLQLLNANCMKGLKQHNKTFWMYKGILGMSTRLVQQIDDRCASKRDSIAILKRNSQQLLERSTQTKRDALALVNKSFTANLQNPIERKVLAIASELHQHLQQSAQLNARETDLTPMQRFQQIHQHAMNLLDQLDAIPLDVLRVAEKFMRANRRMVRERVADALNKQKRYDLMLRQIENHFSEVVQFRRVQMQAKVLEKPNE